jgi:hypothetical protein
LGWETSFPSKAARCELPPPLTSRWGARYAPTRASTNAMVRRISSTRAPSPHDARASHAGRPVSERYSAPSPVGRCAFVDDGRRSRLRRHVFRRRRSPSRPRRRASQRERRPSCLSKTCLRARKASESASKMRLLTRKDCESRSKMRLPARKLLPRDLLPDLPDLSVNPPLRPRCGRRCPSTCRRRRCRTCTPTR